MALMEHEGRVDKRDPMTLPVQLPHGHRGVTRDLSVSGVYVEIDSAQSVGDQIDLTIEVTMDNQQVLLRCHGLVVRVENRGQHTGVAVKMLDTQIEPLN